MDLLYRAGKLTVAPLVRLGWRIHVTGLEHVPARGGVILAANHLSVADQLFLGVVVPRQVHFWAKSEYFQLPGLKGAVIKGVVSGLGAIPVHREGGRAALGALDAAIPVLRSGAVVGIFPEGTRSPDGRLYRGRTGTARLSVAAEVPVVPVGIIGTDRVQPIGQRFPTPGKRVTIPRAALLEMRFDLRPDDSLLDVRQLVQDLVNTANAQLPFAYRIDRDGVALGHPPAELAGELLVGRA